MIKSIFAPKFRRGKDANLGKFLETCQIYRVFLTFSGRGLSFQGKNGTIAPEFPGEIPVISVLTLLFRLSFPKIWLFNPHKIIFLT